MQIKTILNHCQKFKSFVYGTARLVDKGTETTIEIPILPRKNSRPICSKCDNPGPIYDTAREPRLFEFIAIWGIKVFLVYFMRRVDCKPCGVTVEKVPWGNGKHRSTTVYMQFLAHWAKRLSWKEVAEAFNSTWDIVYDSLLYVVTWGLEHRDLSGITAIGIDEVQWHKGHKYLTLVYQIDKHCIRLLWIGEERCVKTLLRFFRFLGKDRTAELKYICSDMWKPYLKVIKKKAGNALHILDRFHIVATLNKALNQVRADEHKNLLAKGISSVLTRTKFLFLKNPGNLTEMQEASMVELLQMNLRSIRAYLLKEEFQCLWEYVRPEWAGKFIDAWCNKVMRSRLEPMKKVAKSIRKHKPLILNWFKAKKEYSCGIVEGLNNKVKLTIRKSYGFRTFKCTEIALFHSLGRLPEPKLTHRFY